jgi:hypothetical protein
MAMVATFATQSVPPGLGFDDLWLVAFAGVCCAIVGWPLSRALSRYLLYWEPCDPRALRRARLRDEDK